jgi:TonB-linked SusC/RagA family outer membrane protein
MEKRLTMLMCSLFLLLGGALAQTKISGTVYSQEDGQPIIGAAVKVVGTSTGMLTDVNGRFSVAMPSGSSQIEVSYLGYESQTVKAKNGMRVFLKADAKMVDEVIVVAYGTAKKSSFTGSATAIGSEKIESRPVTNVTKALDGQVSGVTVTSGSGQPGSGASVVIRGFGSINASNSPLYVVDGIPYDGSISAINPQDIESMTVLKDASASALYGSRAANGVIIITTKKGKEGRPQVSLHNTVGWAWRALPKYELVNQEEYAELTFESLRNDYIYNSGLSYDDAVKTAMANMGSKLGSELYNPYKNYTWATLIDPATGKVKADAKSAWNEDWMDPLYNEGAFRHEHSMAINGGTDKTNYMLSLGYVNEDGILKTTGFQRYSARANIDTQVTDWFKAGLNTNLSYTKSTYSQYDGTSTSNPWYTAQFSNPLYPLYEKDANGNTVLDSYGNPQLDYGENGRPVAADHNPLGGLVNDKSYSSRDNAGVRTYLTFGSDKDNFGWAKGLKLTLTFGADYSGLTETDMMNKFHGNQKNAGGLIEKYATRDLSYTFNQQLTWNRKFGEHSIGALLGHEFYQYTYQYLKAAKTNIVDGIFELRPASTTYDADSYSIEHDIEAYFGRLNYNYAEKYYFDASMRRDGSSRFHKDNRWGTFWSVGANWRVSAEDFMKQLKWIDNLSFKISYGENGNESLSSYYAWQNLYSLAYPNGNKIGGFVSTLENKDLSWEKNGMLNIGLEGAVLGNRLRFSVEFFNKKTTDMLLNYPMALSTGFTGYDANVGSMRNWGWEFMLSGTLVKTKNVVWNLTWMGTTQKNKVLNLTEQSNQIVSGVRIIKEGYPLYTFYMAKSAGVDPNTGAQLYYAYKSMDDDGNVEGEYITTDYAKAATSKYFVGDRTPDLYGSISTDLKFFNCIDLSILTTYSIGGKIYDSLYYGAMKPLYYASDTWSKNVLRRWQKPGDITDVPRVEVGGQSTVTSNYLVDASYFAIKNITLGYTLPTSIARKLYLSGLRVFTSFDNVALFTHLKGLDPQYNFTGGTDYAYSPNKTFSVGLDINF